MENDIYNIYVDACWTNKTPYRYSGAYVIYFNDDKIEVNSKIMKHDGKNNAEDLNLNRAMILIANKFSNKNREQTFNFKIDCAGLSQKCKAIKHDLNNKVYDYKNNSHVNNLLATAIKKYGSHKVNFEWINREQNSEADNLAKCCYNDYLYKLAHNLPPSIHMYNDLEPILNKWKRRGYDVKEKDIVNKLESLMIEISNI